jgi:hypothetical protein
VSADRILALSIAADSMAKLDAAVRTANASKSMRIETRAGGALPSDDCVCSAFSTFYSHLDGTARCFEIFDAGDTTLWAEALPFSHLFVFPTAAHARRALDAYSGHLIAVTPQLLQSVTAQVGLDPVDTNHVMFRVWYDAVPFFVDRCMFCLESIILISSTSIIPIYVREIVFTLCVSACLRAFVSE